MTPEFETLTLPDQDQPHFDLRQLAIEEFGIAAKAFFAPFYGAGLVLQMLSRRRPSKLAPPTPAPAPMTKSATRQPAHEREASLSG